MNKYKMLPGEDAVDVSRATIYGNPFVMKGVADRDRVCDEFEAYVAKLPRSFIVQATRELKGRNLKCFCWPLRCHACTWLRIVNDPTYIDRHYPITNKTGTMQSTQQVLEDYKALVAQNPEIVAAYGTTPAKLIKDNKLLSQNKAHLILKRYCSQLSIFNRSLIDYETSCTHYYHQQYFAHSIDEIALLTECRFNYSHLLELHVASLMFFNTLATIAASNEIAVARSKASLLDKFTPPDMHDVKTAIIAADAINLPGTNSSVGDFLLHYKTLLDL